MHHGQSSGDSSVSLQCLLSGPLAPVRRKSARQKITATQNFEYPLVFDQQRWQPFRRSAYMAKRHEVLKPEDKKFFGALIKPRAYNSHLESFTTAEKNSGAVFRALPVYRVKTPKKPQTPDLSLKTHDDEEKNRYAPSSIFGIAQAIKAPPAKITGRRSQPSKLPALASSTSALNGTGLSFSPVSRPR